MLLTHDTDLHQHVRQYYIGLETQLIIQEVSAARLQQHSRPKLRRVHRHDDWLEQRATWKEGGSTARVVAEVLHELGMGSMIKSALGEVERGYDAEELERGVWSC